MFLNVLRKSIGLLFRNRGKKVVIHHQKNVIRIKYCGTYRMITNGVSDYIDLLVRIAHIICNHPVFYGITVMHQ